MRPIATDTADFPQLRDRGCIYVDKTAYLHRMIADKGTSLFFISRPRRFGKSLMISTLKSIFEGRRELFGGLAIEKTDWKWEKWPVIHFDFSNASTSSLESFDNTFALIIRDSLQKAGYSYDDDKPAPFNFGRAIEELSAANGGKGVVILIDEYDAPVGHSLDDIAKADAIRARMSEFYIQMKSRTGMIRFMIMTGVSKFSKLSVFSALNNIVDVSQDDEYATMLGYTEDELSANFEEHLRAHAEKMKKPYEEYRAEMKRWYNGFRFAKYDETTVYNPISVALTLAKKQPGFSATWASTGRPSSLMNYLKREELAALDYENVTGVVEQTFDVADLKNLAPIPMLYQSGYLTIKDYIPDAGLYTLGVPDEEVRRDLAMLITGAAADRSLEWAATLGGKLVACAWPDFFAGLKSLYANLPYGSGEGRVHEFSYERVLCTLLASQGFRHRAEAVQSDGRADVVADHAIGTYIFELKVGEPVDRAFAQIRAKGYAEPYRANGKPIWAVALSFDSKTRRLVDAAAERI